MQEFDMTIQNANGHDDVTVVYSGYGSDLVVESILHDGFDVQVSQELSEEIFAAALVDAEEAFLDAADRI